MGEIITKYGAFQPQFEDDGVRRKYKSPVTYYETGAVESITLQTQSEVRTNIGILPAERLLFYPDGSLRRLFPLDGKISAYWTEEDERQLAQEMCFQLPFGNVRAKVISLLFYNEGEIKSITLWSRQTVRLMTPIEKVNVRIGISLYRSGAIRSCEPASVTPVETPIGTIRAFDPTAIGIHGDSNSLVFTDDGKVASVVTSVDQIQILTKDGEHIQWEPGLKQNLFQPEVMDIIPLQIVFYQDELEVRYYQHQHKNVGNRSNYSSQKLSDRYSLTDCTFKIMPYVKPGHIVTSACSSCAAHG